MRRLVGAGPLAWAVLLLGAAAAVLMIATEFSTIQSIKIGESTCGAADQDIRDVCETSGGDAHNWALLVLGLFTALLTFGAAVGRSRPAALALGAVGLIVLAIALLVDRPDLDNLRNVDKFYDAEAVTGGGYTLERIAGVLALVAAGLALLRERRAGAADERARRTRRRRTEEAAADSAA